MIFLQCVCFIPCTPSPHPSTSILDFVILSIALWILLTLYSRGSTMDALLQSGRTTNVYLDKHVTVRCVAGVTCVLSMLGSALVILSYCFKDVRSPARHILVNLSLMDFGVGLANFIGITVFFDRYYFNPSTGATVPPSFFNMSYMDDLCKAQAFFAAFTTFASVFWTITLAMYMYLLVFKYWKQMNKLRFFCVAYLFNYLLSAGICVWLLLTNRLGHAPYNSSGWCGIINNKLDGTIDFIVTAIGYDLWIYLAMVICSTVYVAILLYLKTQVSLLRYGNVSIFAHYSSSIRSHISVTTFLMCMGSDKPTYNN